MLPEEERQLNRRPSTCPFCDHVLSDKFTWYDDDRLVSWIDCPECEWCAYVVLEVVDPNAP